MNKQLPLYIVSAIAIIFITLFFYERGQAKERMTIANEEVVKTASAPIVDPVKAESKLPTELAESPAGITEPKPTPEQQDDLEDSVAAAVAAVNQAKAEVKAEKTKANKLDKWAVRLNPETDGGALYPSQRVTGPYASYKSVKTATGNLKASLALGCSDFVLMAESTYDVSNVTCKNLYGLSVDGGAYFLAKLSYQGKQYALTVPVDSQGRYGDLSLEPWE